ncbi:MAG TPA: class I SAM-dependent methyltransferase [Candidatus Caenarcaniphilales bacterium]
MDKDFTRNWPDYYQAVTGGPPRETLREALKRFERHKPADSPRFAVDLGCGEGRDTIELLKQGWRVLAIDSHPEGIKRLLKRPDLPPYAEGLETCLLRFEDAHWPDADLVNASFSLPFCPPESFASLWDKIVRSLRPGGRFAGQLFGDQDDWATISTLTHHTRQQVKALLQPFEIEVLDEVEQEGKTALNQPKHWHLFHIVARKQ